MPFSTAAPPTAALRQGNSPLSAPRRCRTIDSYPCSFSATGAEYFRIWIVNMLLIVVTLGIYMPWAKVRKLKYFYSNTRINEHALDFHGEPKKMLRGTAIVGVFFMVYSQAASIAPVAGRGGLGGAVGPVAAAVSRQHALSAGQHQLARHAFSVCRCAAVGAVSVLGAAPGAAAGPQCGDGFWCAGCGC